MSTAETEYLEAASLLSLSEPTIYRRVWAGDIPVVRLSAHGAIRIPKTALEAQAHDGRNEDAWPAA